MLYLAYVGAVIDPEAEGPWEETFVLGPDLLFVRSDLHRSAVYHGLKDVLPPGTALLVAECDDVPKFKGLPAGALAWARRAVS